jgi:hypothetical protein
MLNEEGELGGQEETTMALPPPHGNLKVTRQDVSRPQKVDASAGEDRQEAISPGPFKGSVSDRRVGCCLEPKGNGVNPGEGDEGGPGPPSREQDKQLTVSRGGDNSIMEQEEDRKKGQV